MTVIAKVSHTFYNLPVDINWGQTIQDILLLLSNNILATFAEFVPFSY